MTGILNIYKPKGLTSHNVVSFVRRTLKMKRVGHTGTLDPMATGVLPVLVGNATKLSELIMADEKRYIARVTLGIKTDTEDITGEVLVQKDVNVTLDDIIKAAEKFTGETDQIPPMYSAIKVGGQKLYKLARQGVEIERKARKITIHSIDIYDFDGTSFTMDVHCSKGTYIRSLCRDMGDALGCGATMSELERTMSGIFKKENSYTFEQIEEIANSGKIREILMAPDDVLGDFVAINVSDENAKKIKNGIRLRPNQLGISDFCEDQMFRIYEQDTLICLLKVKDCDGQMLLTMEKSFY